ncbi:MAG: hypothetical protein HMLKMBBP_00869 [Planctomycetes bacterium]|nr:hypothetical protein [Planctomycetota bacterium]
MTVSGAPFRVAVDRGGTFTDVVATGADGRISAWKVPTDRGGAAVIRSIRERLGAPEGGGIPSRTVREVRWSTTVATNALLERRGARCALVVTRGFADLPVIGSQERPDLFDLDVRRDPPLCERVFEVGGRIGADGSVVEPLDRGAVERAGREMAAAGIGSAAVAFVHGHLAPQVEDEAAAALRAAGVPHVVTSHACGREIGFLARMRTAVADAYLTPPLRASLADVRAAFADDVQVWFVTSDGGLSAIERVRGAAAVLSGPAGGALAVARVLAASGAARGVGFDMGGTSTDVCRVEGVPERMPETEIGRARLRAPSIRVRTVAAGGGSVLSFDGRRLHVGPESAGADPGPAGYGRGGPATLTDADAVLGRLVPESFPAAFGRDGRSPFDVDASRRALAPLAARLGMPVEDAALAFVRVADEHVAHAVREESLLRGHDVRDHALVAFGGAGPQHACAVAAALGAPEILVSRHASVLSALGVSTARPSHAASAGCRIAVSPETEPDARRVADGLAAEARAVLRSQGVGQVRIAVTVDVRVSGMDASIPVPLGPTADLRAAFAAAHRRLFGFPPAADELEIAAVRVRAECAATGPGGGPARDASPVGSPPRFADVAFLVDGRAAALRSAVVALASVADGDRIAGPALVVDERTTIVVEPGFELRCGVGALRIVPVSPPDPPRATTLRDPVTLTLFANAFMSLADRMGAVLERTSRSTSIKERLDFSCAVFDGGGRLVANAPHVPVHLGAMGESVRAVLAASGDDGLQDGDCILTNDPCRGGSHLPDVTMVTPVLVGGARFFVASRAHHADVGGRTPGSMPPDSTTLDEEGVRVHGLLVVRDGAFLEDAAMRGFASRTRGAEDRIVDLRAQAAASAEGARLLREMCAKHGADVVAAQMAHVLDDGEEAMREALSALPEGTSAFEDALDDGTPIRASVTIGRGGAAVVDFAGTGPRGRTNLHAPPAVVRAAVLYAFRTLVRRPIPLNEGCLRPLDLRIPAGSLLDPAPGDAVVGGNVETSQRIVDVVLASLGVSAPSQGTMNNVSLATPRGAYYETLGGGMGAGPARDGASAVQCHMTNTRITDVEVLESRFPVRVRAFAVRRQSGGPGAHRGGDGLVREFEFLEPCGVGLLSERRARGAPGLRDGAAGAPGRNTLLRSDGSVVPLAGRAVAEAAPGDVLRVETPGGGGYGRG